MAYEKLSPITLIAAVQDKVEILTGLKCYDHVPPNEKKSFLLCRTGKNPACEYKNNVSG